MEETWRAAASGILSTQNGSQDPVNPFLPSTRNGAVSRPCNPFFSSAESQANGFIHSSAFVDPFSPQSRDSNTRTDDEENKPIHTLNLSSKQNNGWCSSPAPFGTTDEPLKADSSPSLPKNDWAVFSPSASSQEVKHQKMTSTNQTPSELPQTGSTKQKTDIFQPYKAKEANNVFQSMAGNENIENTKSSNEKDHLLDYILSSQKINDAQPTSSPMPVSSWLSDVFEDTFVPPPVITTNLCQSPTGTPASVSSDIFHTPLSSIENGVLQSTPLFQTPSSVPCDIKAFDPLASDSAVKFQERDFSVNTPLGTGIFQESPTVTPRPKSLADGGLMFRRHIPKPAPRSKVSKSINQATYPHTLATPPAVPPTLASSAETSPMPPQPPLTSTPALPTFTRAPPTSTPAPPTSTPAPPTSTPAPPISTRAPPISTRAPPTSTPAPPTSTPAPPTFTRAPPTSTPAHPIVVPHSIFNIQDTTQAEENDKQVYDDILFIGQEKCVEDWPEDSPELSPGWKPAGKLKLRRDSIKISTAESEGVLTNSLGRKNSKQKTGKKFRSSILSRRGSKNKPGDDLKVTQTHALSQELMERTPDSINSIYGSPLPWDTKSQDGTMDDVFSPAKVEQIVAMDNKPAKKKEIKLAVPHLRYRQSKVKLRNEGLENEACPPSPLQAGKEDVLEGAGYMVQSGRNVWTGKEKSQEMKDCRPKEPVKSAINHLVHHQPPKDPFECDPKKMNEGFFPNEGDGATSFTPSWESKAGYQDEMFSPKGADNSMSLHSSGKAKEMQDCRPKKPVKPKVARLPWKGSKGSRLSEGEGGPGYTPSRQSKDEMSPNDLLTPLDSNEQIQEMQGQSKKPIKLRVPRLPRKGSKSRADERFQQKGADLFKASDIKTSEFNTHKDDRELKKPPILRVPLQSYSDSVKEIDAGTPEKGAGLSIAEEEEYSWVSTEEYTPDTKLQKLKKSKMLSRDSKAKDEAYFLEDVDPTGATSSDYYLSEAAKAEWKSSQMDVRRVQEPEDEQELDVVEEEEEGDTDSLMEWWNNVELWDEVPSDEEISLKEDETKSFIEIAGKVHRGIRVFYKGFTEQAEVLYQHVMFLYTIADDLSNFHRRAKIANITGGTTTAVGGVAAIAGLALSPFTMGASLIVSAVGLGVATAGGITAASAAISDNVNDMSDRKKIELIVHDYETRLTELQRCLRFVAEGIRRQRCHPLLRRNNYYSGDWEVRRALQTISLVTEPVERAEEITGRAIAALNNECKGIDKYFTKDSRELKKGCKKELTARVRLLAKQLQEGLVELNSIRDELLDATGHV